MKRILSLSIIFFGFTYAVAQDLYLVKLKPKENTSSFLLNPLQMLSQRSLDRRKKYTISINEEDVPISEYRINQIKKLTLNYIGHTKWLNSVMVEISNEEVLNELIALNFVESAETMVRNSLPKTSLKNQSKWKDLINESEKYNYGYAEEFINQINLKPLHENNILGQGVLIAVIDAGFPGVDKIAAFDILRKESRIIDTYDFVDKKKQVYDADRHGTMVLSTMAAEIEGNYVGTAPKATYSLYRSEDNNSETPKELMYWIQAAERADSIGSDVINTSLGYYAFDDARYDYTFDNMDGKTTLISKGAEVAANKGIFVVVAAGNEGNSSWKRISAPADVKNVFSIGANDSYKNPAGFSSFGPNALGEIKPNVSALGQYIVVCMPDGNLTYSNGTSFASPVSAGAVALMIQQFPKVAHEVLKQNIQQSAHLFSSPSDQLGYGVPNYYMASQELLKTNEIENTNTIKIYPNPFKEVMNVQSKEQIKKIELYNLIGQKIISINNQNSISTNQLKSGIYLINITDSKGNTLIEKVVKK